MATATGRRADRATVAVQLDDVARALAAFVGPVAASVSICRASGGYGIDRRLCASLDGEHRPTGPRVALLTGCLMEAVFREINFATVRVLIENNVQVTVPREQGCCGAFQEHLGLDGIDQLQDQNRRAFGLLEVDAVVCNSSGCGLALGKTLHEQISVRDVLGFVADLASGVRRTKQPLAAGGAR